MAKKGSEPANGPKLRNGPLYHWDIYALFFAPQEIFFGHETQVNRSLIEMVVLPDGSKRVYLSPTKRRGVERRALLNAPVNDGEEGKLLTDVLGCGIPNTCGKEDCPVCRVYGALVPEGKDRVTFVGRLTHGGGVAIPGMEPLEKQRAMHPSPLRRKGPEEGESMLFRRQYAAPGLLFPVYNHALSMSEEEFRAAAYAFLESLPRLGASNPKGLALYEDVEFGPYLVLDRYLVPLGRRVVLDPTIDDFAEALGRFRALAKKVPDHPEEGIFQRWVGEEALRELHRLSTDFVTKDLRQLGQKGSKQ